MPMSFEPPIDTSSLLHLLPHRFPFLLVDRILEIEYGDRIVGLKNVTRDEPYLAGQRGDAVMPGTLIIEALAQTGAVLLMMSSEAGEHSSTEHKLVFFATLHNATFDGLVRAGDQLRLEITVTHAKGRMRKVHGTALVDGRVVAEADLAAVLVDPTVKPLVS